MVLDEPTLQVLRRAAQDADFVLVHAEGKAGAPIDSTIAKDQAQATVRMLVQAGVEAHKLRMSWRAGETGSDPTAETTVKAGVVEVEFVQRAKQLLFSRPAGKSPATESKQAPAKPAETTPPALATLAADVARR